MQKRNMLGRGTTPLWLSLLIGVSACSVAEFQESEVVVPSGYSFAAPPPDMAELNAATGLSFRDAVLDQLLASALEGNLSIAEARARLDEAAAGLRSAGANTTGNLELSRTETSSDTSTASTSLDASFSPFGLGRARIRAAQAQFDAAQLSELDARRLVMSELASTYVDLRYFQQLLVYRKQDLQISRSILRDVTEQAQTGAATRFEVVQTRAQVAQAEAQIPVLEASIVQTRNQISTLLGQPVGALNVDLSFSGEQPHPHGSENIGVPADMVRARPDIQQAERLYASSLASIDAAKAARYPRLTLSGTITAPLDAGSNVQSLVGGLVLPVFSQNALAADIESAQAQANQAFIQWRSAVLTAIEEVESNLVVMQASKQSVSASRSVVALNRESLQLSRDLLASGGNVTVIDVLDSEQDLSNSQIDVAESLRDLGQNYVALRTALGIETVPAELYISK